jgi:hypothetical protein
LIVQRQRQHSHFPVYEAVTALPAFTEQLKVDLPLFLVAFGTIAENDVHQFVFFGFKVLLKALITLRPPWVEPQKFSRPRHGRGFLEQPF